MPIELYTGKPGNAKTAFLVDRILQEREKENPRYLVAIGINGLADGLVDDVMESAEGWAEITDRTQGPCRCPLIGGAMVEGQYPPHTHRIPPGALIFVDEAWKWFGHLHEARGQQTPKHALDLAEHRHMGVDFVWTAQGPNQIYPFVRNLIADHTHHVRRFGTHFVDTWKWEELQEDVKSEGKRSAGLHAVKVIPKRTFGLYKSAEQHTIKRKIPLRVLLLPGILLAAVLCAWLAYKTLRPLAATASPVEGPESALADLGPAPRSVRSEEADKEPLTPEEYAALHLPRFATMPHTAPVFDDRPPLSDPQLFCMSSKPGLGGTDEYKEELGCQCITEQGTKYDIEAGHCLRVARWGAPYNPYKERRYDNGQSAMPAMLGAHVPVEVAAGEPSVVDAVGIGDPAQQVTRYGGFRSARGGNR